MYWLPRSASSRASLGLGLPAKLRKWAKADKCAWVSGGYYRASPLRLEGVELIKAEASSASMFEATLQSQEIT